MKVEARSGFGISVKRVPECFCITSREGMKRKVMS